MQISIVDVVKFKYPGQFESGKVGFYQPNDRILIHFWHVDGVEQPTEDYLESLFSEYQNQFDIQNIYNESILSIQLHIEDVAKSGGYDSALSCASYVSSTNPEWALQANKFITWRDGVWAYCYQEFDKLKSGQRQIVSVDAFINELPVIVWA